jgi:hypothetical protein
VEDGSIGVDLPSLGVQHVFLLTELCFHCWGIFGLENYTAIPGDPSHNQPSDPKILKSRIGIKLSENQEKLCCRRTKVYYRK